MNTQPNTPASRNEAVADERALFESHIVAEGYNAEHWPQRWRVGDVADQDRYIQGWVQTAWEAWKKRAALASPGAAIAAREQDGDAWQPIETAKKHGDPVWLFDPALIDPDANPTGTVDGHWQDDEGWKGAVWSMHFDEWRIETINPTHWMARSMPVSALASRPEAPPASASPATVAQSVDMTPEELFNLAGQHAYSVMVVNLTGCVLFDLPRLVTFVSALRAQPCASQGCGEGEAVYQRQDDLDGKRWLDIDEREYNRVGALYRRIVYRPPAPGELDASGGKA